MDAGSPVDAGSSDGGSPDSGIDAGTGGALAFTLTDLGPGTVSSIDSRGRVAGNPCPNGDPPCPASIYTPGSGWTPLPVPDGATGAVAIGIDENDTVVLNAWFLLQRTRYRRAHVDPGARPFPTASQPPQTTLFNAIHSATGHMVGYDEALGGGFLYDGTTITPIAVQPGKSFDNGGPSQATALNAHDQVVGWMRPMPQPGSFNSTPAHAFLWDHGAATDLGSRGQCDSQAVGINDSGLVAGVIDVGERCGEPRVFRWDGQMHILGCPDGAMVCTPYAINARGDIIGNALASVGSLERAFIHRDGAFHWLDELVDVSGWTLQYAVSMNDTGQIVGWGGLAGVPHAFLLTPR